MRNPLFYHTFNILSISIVLFLSVLTLTTHHIMNKKSTWIITVLSSLLLGVSVLAPEAHASFTIAIGAHTGGGAITVRYDSCGFPIWGYTTAGFPIYAYSASGLPILTTAGIVRGCYVPPWAPAAYYRGSYIWPTGVLRCAYPRPLPPPRFRPMPPPRPGGPHHPGFHRPGPPPRMQRPPRPKHPGPGAFRPAPPPGRGHHHNR